MRSFLIALQFLTSIPLRIKKSVGDNELAGSMAYFPLAGFLIGTALALAYNILNLIFPHAVNCAFILILNVIITGGLHIDGFIDTFDGIASGGDKKRMLEIMREGRPGAVGIAAAILLFLSKYSLLVSLPNGTIEMSLIMMAGLSRWSFVISSALYPYARGSEGLGKRFIQGLRPKGIFIATATILIVTFLVFKSRVFILIPVILCAILAFNFYLCKKIGGITGDTLGALGEIIEVLSLAVSVILF